MKNYITLLLLASMVVLAAIDAQGQNKTSAAQTADYLRSQILEIQSKELSLQGRLRQLNEDLIPENIERNMSRMGSTRPEELRAQRKKELEAEKANVEAQLNQLETSRDRLSAALRIAESEAYVESAQVGSSGLADNAFLTQSSAVPRWMVRSLAGAVSMLGIFALISLFRKHHA